ncbi:mandelate racemase/muconate lactonizing enzyme family protein [Desulfovibrio piger]|jgi:D-galactarolactone cycloisomerase|uniref:mandelate racemase/muconate lactonizing enzyme family protein n=1 Tax=Desulfovibrio piger TaxID=901 RepID=UPI00242C6BDB|nr:mandelate racemase/muconate lactonizing enzyme family protein [Desulfovibrio piger]MCI6941339.1 mandelate racemase/muconate lactonizing enzyme family protein [Desulfovibrio piger]
MATDLVTAPVRSAEIFVFRAPIEKAVRTSFGIMHDRPAVLLRLEDEDGMHGWGEAWCNFPSCGAEHRARLLETAILPKVIGKPWSSPAALSAEISGQLEVLRLQADEPGPMSQALAALDIALWDLAARRAGLPLHRFLGGCGDGSMPVYASGINHPDIAGTIRRTRAEGYRCFKIKIGFSEQSDAANLEEAFAALLPGEDLAVDVNQAWTRRQALAGVEKLRRWPLLWIEEPLRCDSPVEDWAALAAASPHPLAAGENIRSHTDFSAAIIRRDLGVIQPDICKWGGLSNCLPVARAVLKAGLRYCPHYLGGGIGLLASAHLLAAVGGDGLLEVDCNPNPLRELLARPFPAVREGRITLSDAAGLGVEPDLDAVENLVTYRAECR